MMRKVAVVGVGMTKFGELWDKSLRNLFVEAALAAIKDSGVDHLDHMEIGCMTSGLFNGQEHLASLFADHIGQPGLSAGRSESACASGGLAFDRGYLEVASGRHEIVLVGGVEKQCDVSGDAGTFALGAASDAENELFHGLTFPGIYAMMAVAHMEKYGTTRDMLSAVAVKNHENGSMNPFAQFPNKITLEAVSNSVMVADPLRILDCSPVTDGAAAVVLMPVEMAKDLGKPIISVLGTGHATDTIALQSREDLTTIKSATLAAERALKMADLSVKNIDFCEVHDCFTIAELMVLESMGFFEPGKAGQGTLNGETSLNGWLPVNPSGGLKSKGHPVGATGIAQVVEIVKQLRGTAEGGRQLNNPKIGLAHNMGGSGGSSLVNILGKEAGS